MNITLYTTHCPMCKVLEKKLQAAGLEYEINENIEDIKALGYMSVPILVVDGDDMNFKEACIWVDGKGSLD